MRVRFATLRRHFPDTFNVSQPEIMHWVGHPHEIGNPGFENTCAIRLSLALLGAGYPNPGAWPVKAGKYAGRKIETRQRKLSDWLIRQLGQPERCTGGIAKERIGQRTGIISFFNLYGSGDNQGHIDIIMPDRGGYLRCGNENPDRGGCYWTASSVWFWPLP